MSEATTVHFRGGPWDGQTYEVERIVGPVFAVGHEIGNAYWLDSKSDPPTYHWNGPGVTRCWQDGDGSTCLLPDRHGGPHEFTPDSDITLVFPEEPLMAGEVVNEQFPTLAFDDDGRLTLSFGSMNERYAEPYCCECGQPISWVLDMFSFKHNGRGGYDLGHAWCLWTPAAFEKFKAKAGKAEATDGR